MEFYKKEGRRYRRVYETPRLYADGVWLVKNEQRSASRILKIGELPELYPFAQMMQSHENLSTWLTYKGINEIFGSIEIAPKTLRYVYRCASDVGRDILRFLALSKEEQDAEIKELQKQTHVDYDGDVRDATGKLIHSGWTKEAILEQIKQKEKQIEELKAKL